MERLCLNVLWKLCTTTVPCLIHWTLHYHNNVWSVSLWKSIYLGKRLRISWHVKEWKELKDTRSLNGGGNGWRALVFRLYHSVTPLCCSRSSSCRALPVMDIVCWKTRDLLPSVGKILLCILPQPGMLSLLLILKGNVGTMWTGKKSLDCLSSLEQQGEAHSGAKVLRM